MKKKILGLFVVLVLCTSIVFSALAATYSAGRYPCGVTLSTGSGRARGEASDAEGRGVKVKVIVQHDVMTGTGEEETEYATASGSGINDAIATVSYAMLGTITGQKAKGYLGSTCFATCGYGVGF
jgi:hypothetical protein